MHLSKQSIILLISCGFAMSGLLQADVISQQAWNAEQRFNQFPNVFDRTDQYCLDAKVGAACVIPGTAFAGGGQGVCERDFEHGRRYIDLRCVPINQPRIERQIPDGRFRRDARDCDDNPQNKKEVRPFECVDPAPVSDHFCRDHRNGDACIAEFMLAGKPQQESGRCTMTIEQYKYYHYGYRIATRPVLQCIAIQPAPAAVFTPVPLSKKLLP